MPRIGWGRTRSPLAGKRSRGRVTWGGRGSTRWGGWGAWGGGPGVVGIIAGGLPALTRSQEGAEDDTAAAVHDVNAHGVSAKDVVLGIAASGTTPYVRAALGRGQRVGGRAVLLPCSDPPP